MALENISSRLESPEKMDKIKNKTGIRNLLTSISVFVLLWSYFIWCTIYRFRKSADFSPFENCCDGYGFLVIIFTIFNYGYFHIYIFKPYVLPFLERNVIKPIVAAFRKLRYGEIIIATLFLTGFLAYLIFDAYDDLYRLMPLSGLVIFLFCGYIFSNNRSKIPWRTVAWGLILQFIFGLLTIRWEVGRQVFDCIGNKTDVFLGYALKGAEMVYGEELVYSLQVFAFAALSTILFLGFVINILYYYGIMQMIVKNLGSLLQTVMGTSICESVNSAANIFLSQSEAPLLLKPFLVHLTDSEIHSIMTSGFATVSGTILAAYISFGANPTHIITASVMSAPAALCFSKMLCPETEEIKIKKDNVEVTEMEYDSVLDAAAKGSWDAYNIVTGIIANLVAFVGFTAFVNGVLGWLGMLVGYTSDDEIWSIESIAGKIFIPVSFVMGVPWEECSRVGQLIGIKTMVNEFVAFKQLKGMGLTARSEMIATYAICGFSNPGSIGIQISTLSAMVPSKAEAVSRLVFRAFFGGFLVCLMTACIAAMLTS